MPKEYNRQLANEYAEKWAYGRNPKYLDFATLGGDCTNFISQCLFAGGMIMNYTPTFGWFYNNGNSKSPSWTGVEQLYNFLVTSKTRRGPFGETCEIFEVQTGDIIQLSFDGEVFSHSLFVNENTNGEIFVSTHTFDAFHRNLDSYYFNKARAIHILGSHW